MVCRCTRRMSYGKGFDVMPMVQIMMHRELSPEEGQRILENMSQELTGRAAMFTHAFGLLHLPGQTRRDNPFPQWFRDVIAKSNFHYSDVNLTYQREFEKEHLAVTFMEWFDRMLRPYCARVGGEDFAKKLHVRVMDDHEWVVNSDSF